MRTLDDTLAALYAERYGRSSWWKTPQPSYALDDEATCARRRRDLDKAFTEYEARQEATA